METRAAFIKEITYRASYRGTLELDTLCRPLIPELENFDDETLASLAAFLQTPETLLMRWLVEGDNVPEEHQLIVALIKYTFKQSRKK